MTPTSAPHLARTVAQPARRAALSPLPLILSFGLATATLLTLGACSSDMVSTTGHVIERNECQKIQDYQDRRRCLDQADRDHPSTGIRKSPEVRSGQ